MNQSTYRHRTNGGDRVGYKNEKTHRIDEIELEIEVEELGVQASNEIQKEEELIVIRDSCDVKIKLRDVQAALSIQAALQVAIVILLTIEYGDTEKAVEIAERLFQLSKIKQTSKQRIIVDHSKNVYIESSDVQVAANIQILVQLVAILSAKLGVSIDDCD